MVVKYRGNNKRLDEGTSYVQGKIPVSPKETYYVPRVYITVGGNQINYPCVLEINSACFITSRLLFNSIISMPNTRFVTIDIVNMYLHTSLDQYKYMHIPINLVPETFISKYKSENYIKNGFVT